MVKAKTRRTKKTARVGRKTDNRKKVSGKRLSGKKVGGKKVGGKSVIGKKGVTRKVSSKSPKKLTDDLTKKPAQKSTASTPKNKQKKLAKTASSVTAQKKAGKTLLKVAKKEGRAPVRRSVKAAPTKPEASSAKRAKGSVQVAPKTLTGGNLERQISQVNLGEVVPEIVLPGTGEKDFRLSDFRGRRLVLYFYPKDSTPGCTQEGHDFTALHAEFKAANTEVFGISRDSIKSHQNFRGKQNYTFDLLSDSDETVCRLLGVMQPKALYGRKFLGVERSTFVINENGQLVKEWREVKVSGHAQEVLSFIKSLPAAVS